MENNFVINEKIKFIFVDNFILSNKKKFLKKIYNSLINKNKNHYLVSKENLKKYWDFEFKNIESWNEEKLKILKREFKDKKNLNIIFDFSTSKKEFQKKIKNIKKLNFAGLLKSEETQYNENNFLYFILNIDSFSKNGDFFNLNFFKIFYKKILNTNHKFLKSYKPSEEEKDYENDKYIVNVFGNFKSKKEIGEIFDDNYDLWIKNNFIDLRSNFINCFLITNKNISHQKIYKIKEEIFENENFNNPKKTKLIEIKNNEIRQKLIFSRYNKDIIYIFVEGNDDKIFFNKLIRSFPFLKFKIFPIANIGFDSKEINKIINYYIDEDKNDFNNIYLIGIFDDDNAGKNYKLKYNNIFLKKIENIKVKKIKAYDYSYFVKDDDPLRKEVNLEKLLHIIRFPNDKNYDDVKKDKANKYLYDEKNYTNFESYFFIQWIKLIKKIEENY